MGANMRPGKQNCSILSIWIDRRVVGGLNERYDLDLFMDNHIYEMGEGKRPRGNAQPDGHIQF